MNFSKSKLRYFALLLSLPAACIGAASLVSHSFSSLVAHGPIQEAHSDVECVDCHRDAEGSIRQQVQANLLFVLGKRTAPVNFGYQPVTSDQCLACHERPNERHPIYRFNEPRFAKARQELGANSCLGCHSEHTDSRVSVSENVCSSCHDDLLLEQDPLDVHHVELVARETWESCLGCHDFHGNHTHTPQTRISAAFQVDLIQDYFKNGPNPYGSKHFEAEK